jgi:uncharacterized protein DUF4277
MRSRYVVEHLNHLGIVAEVCREIGVAAWLDQQEPGNRQQVSVGTATVALVLNGLGFSNRRLYLGSTCTTPCSQTAPAGLKSCGSPISTVWSYACSDPATKSAIWSATKPRNESSGATYTTCSTALPR